VLILDVAALFEGRRHGSAAGRPELPVPAGG